MSNDSDIRRSVKSTPESKTVDISYNSKTIIKVLAVILLMLLSFAVGQYYGDHHTKPSTAAAFGAAGPGGFRRNGGGIGSVTAVSASSITIQNARTGTSNTYSIDSSTKITDNGQTVSASSIATGDRVLIMPASSGSTVAATIIVNPSFGGGFGGGAPSPAGGSSTSGSATQGSSTGSATQ